MKYSFFILSAINVFSLVAMENVKIQQKQLHLDKQCKELAILRYLKKQDQKNLNNDQADASTSDDFVTMQELCTLDVSKNGIEDLQTGITLAIKLIEISREKAFPHYNINSIISHIKLTRLDLSGNKLTSLPQSFIRLQELKHIDLSNNKFASFPTELCSLPKLTKVNLSDNKITTIPTTIINLINLKKFYVARNNITKIPDQVGALPHLKVLTTQGNPIKEPISDKVLAVLGTNEAMRIQLVTKGVMGMLNQNLSDLYNKVAPQSWRW